MIMQNGIQMIISHNFVANNVKNVQISFQNPNNYIPLNIIKHPCGFSLVWRQLIHLRHAWHVVQWLIITIIFLSILDWNEKKKKKKKEKSHRLCIWAWNLMGLFQTTGPQLFQQRPPLQGPLNTCELGSNNSTSRWSLISSHQTLQLNPILITH